MKTGRCIKCGENINLSDESIEKMILAVIANETEANTLIPELIEHRKYCKPLSDSPLL